MTTVSIAHIGSLIGDPARVVMLQALIDKQTLVPERIGVDLASSLVPTCLISQTVYR